MSHTTTTTSVIVHKVGDYAFGADAIRIKLDSQDEGGRPHFEVEVNGHTIDIEMEEVIPLFEAMKDLMAGVHPPQD